METYVGKHVSTLKLQTSYVFVQSEFAHLNCNFGSLLALIVQLWEVLEKAELPLQWNKATGALLFE